MSELRTIERSLPIQLLLARETTMAHFRPMLRAHDLTDQQWRVLRVLAAAGDSDAGELADAACLLAPSLSRILQTLEARGYVQRSPDPDDQRRSIISLTDTGRDKYREISPNAEDIYRGIERRLGSKELSELNRLLERLNVVLS